MLSNCLPSTLMRALALPASAFLAFSLAACGGGGGKSSPSSPGTPSPVPAPTTTLQAETGNNTSAADSFLQETDGNL
ncbi:MAG TPA: hypothetical protein VF730_15550, partial [Terracidiphilus sp.]